MVIKWEISKLEKENRDLRNRLKACLELINDLSYLDAPLFEADISRKFKMKYYRTVTRAKRFLENK